MGNQVTTQAVVTDQDAISTNQKVESIALFNADGTPYTGRNSVFEPVVVGSAIGTVGKSTTADEPAANTLVPIEFTNGNSAESPTIAFNGGTARQIHLGGAQVAAADCAIAAGGVALFFFDGTVLHQTGVIA